MKGAALAGCLVLLLACACTPQDKLELKPTTFDALPKFANDDHVHALEVFNSSCEVIFKRADDATLGKGDLEAPVSLWKQACAQANQTPDTPEAAKAFFMQGFTPMLATNKGQEEGLFTGYYIPEARGSLTRGGVFQTPVYGLPDDLTDAPYFTRAEINAGALKGRAKPIAWVADPIELFFMEIQGSGMLRLPNGDIFSIGYAGKNNQAFIPIGRVMAQKGMIDPGNITLDTIKDWLRANPKQARVVMEENPSYVFFKHLSDDVIRGGQGVGLTAERSLAIDHRFIPYGMPLFLETTVPEGAVGAPKPFHRVMIAQDTGGAIRGPVRGDVYFGKGKSAELRAGNMKQRGSYTLLIPNAVYRAIAQRFGNAE